MSAQPACFRCGQADRVEKVSVIFGNSAAYPNLAPRLKPPIEPQRPPEKFHLSQNEIALTLVVGFFTAGIGWVALPVLLWQNWRDKCTRYPREHAAWQAALQHWAELFYCARCDVVFAPQTLPALSLPGTCEKCGGALRSDDVKWIDAESAVCPWCGATVKATSR